MELKPFWVQQIYISEQNLTFSHVSKKIDFTCLKKYDKKNKKKKKKKYAYLRKEKKWMKIIKNVVKFLT